MRLRRTPALAALVAVLVAVLQAPAGARVPNRTPQRRLEAKVAEQVASAPARGSRSGILVYRGGREVFSLNADKPMTPASLLKLATTTAALAKFGPDHRFATRVFAPKPVSGTVTSLTLVGGGDPTLATRVYVADHFIPKPDDPAPVRVFAGGSPTIEDLAARIAGTGVRRIAGDLLVDASIFDSQRTMPGWIPDYTQKDPDIAYIAGLTANEGFVDLKQNILAPSPAMQAGTLLRSALAARGVVVAGTVRAGRVPSGAGEIARIESPPLSEIVFWTNRWSINLPAEMLLKSLGAAFGGAGTATAGARVVAETLKAKGIPTAGLTMADGSGLSTLNRVTPRTIAGLLRFLLTDDSKVGTSLRNSIAVAGGPGTLLRRMRSAPTFGNLRGKTGMIRHVRAMAGWVNASDGAPIVYVAMFNDVVSPRLLTIPLDLIGYALARYPYA
jgi:D-alanyl-D-alanine carboxypeptidase/D-alanyl-D-alanine-endopeptidase (penicillin-binding protein 4)